jgi:hypothetical protein
MAVCECCREAKLDVKARPLLRAIDLQGNRTLNPFQGVLCDDCNEKVRHFGTPQHLWLLRQIAPSPPQ